MRKLENKVALITGASRGIGRAIAEVYGREGAKVVVNYVSNKAAADATADAVKAAGGDAVVLQGDSMDPVAVRRLFDEGQKAFGALDIVVANAHPGMPGIAAGAPTQLSEEAIDHQLKVLKGFIVTFQEAGRRVRDNGVIISLSSGTTRLAVPEHCLYSSTKLAIEQLTRALSREVAIRGVRALTLAPGLIRTDRIAGLAVGPTGSAPAPAIPTPFTRPGEPEEVADAALFLASNDARWVNTTTVYVNGGAVYAQ
ncbi:MULTISPECIES: SDR family oxidoreductase [unclassified Bradyrhizobium]|uniref:SDR family oxidoreductase n=1 Tax=unclassified Bradyrhizobium TaxID=2631580 RepID=UPI001606170C|nr:MULTISPECIES: SDR family oxidoreductase [unclassified Bradyrhizobium]MBB4262789.1 3-oxoacyl-[acyl-carrier protein] reductase [Bradyrhizobium sp. CIR3A]MBB4360659.1 3-oxoacyl-[acyl-carrier protein] reductase [Bradyrhizobium sp. CIR18]MBB4429572.1 3-oxoacyl-[acyl-carrier protein] reductase [Bradyrhizobium sp. CIR48]